MLVHLLVYRVWSTIIQGMRLLVQCWCMYWSIGPGLQSSMGCASINLSVSIYNHPRDASVTALSVHVLAYNHPSDASISALLVHVSLYRSRSTIIQGMRLFLHCRCIYRFIGFGLRSSKGCVYWCNVGACTGLLVPVTIILSIYRSRSAIIQEMCLILRLLVLVYNHPRETSIGATLVHVLVYQARFTIIQGIRFFSITGTVISLLGMG